ncbi:MAG: 5-formyltetrahydrofolate cyclo-ligase [Alphaproteobacteria bacterium]|nr:MAG: 5-formyltetrahydrofolate cyclo-ligase [Alphaproteobacteria bacterium]
MPNLSKTELRKKLRALRREHATGIPETVRGLLFRHPPAPVLDMIPDSGTIGLYNALPEEAPTAAYAAFFHERGHAIALPRFSKVDAAMEFALHSVPHAESDLEIGPFGMLQPGTSADLLAPDVLFVPLVGFTERGDRLGQGGGHYDRWLGQHPGTIAIGLAWDCQLVDSLPTEPHDRKLSAVVTPTRFYGPFDA